VRPPCRHAKVHPLTKSGLRREILEKRLALTPADVSEKSDRICRRLVSDGPFRTAKTIGLYWPFKKEVGTESIFYTATREQKDVGFPRVLTDEKRIVYIAVSDLGTLAPGTYGIMEPPDDRDRLIPCDALDLVIVPGVVFDERGFRIGYGGGYFDRLLGDESLTAQTAGLAYDLQVIGRIPEENHDRRVDVIFTESRTIWCS
jgi:5-formyltetrahydrofolate cyclo-ligase